VSTCKHLVLYIPLLVAGSVVATCRDPSRATELQQLLDRHPNQLMVVAMDVANEDSIQARLPLHTHEALEPLAACLAYDPQCESCAAMRRSEGKRGGGEEARAPERAVECCGRAAHPWHTCTRCGQRVCSRALL